MTLPAESTVDTGATAGFEHRVAPVMGDLYRQALRLTRQHADAEDLVQDTLTKAFAGFDSCRADDNIGGWLHRILVNTHISNCRKNRRRPTQHFAEHVTELQVIVNAARSVRRQPSAEDQALKGFGDQDLIAAMRALPDQFRTTVYYADVEGLRCREIAAVMNAPIGTVVSRLHRARRQLRRLLAEAGRDEGHESRRLAQTA
ncbi:MAG: sigma-70 family RNA polymerase sigma factor [Mycobacterium sp.]